MKSKFKVVYLPPSEFNPKRFQEGIRALLHLVKIQEEMDKAEELDKGE